MKNYGRILKTISVAIFVSLGSQIRLEVIGEGFIVAMSVVIMTIFLYCYEDLKPAHIIILAGIFSPAFRLTVTYFSGGQLQNALAQAAPDFAFFFPYAIFFTFIYRFVVEEPKSIRNFPFVIFFCEIFSNICELTCRSILVGHNLLSLQVIITLVAIAVVRTLLVTFIIAAIDYYSAFLVKQEHDAEYRKLLTQASIFESELTLMEKNAAEIEDVMKKAYALHQSAQDENYPEAHKKALLDIAREAHEIKGDYLSAVAVLKETYVGNLSEEGMKMSAIIALERTNALTRIRETKQKIEIHSRIKADYTILDSFPMMSILRNLLTNAAEAIDTRPGTIQVNLFPTVIDESRPGFVLRVRDNGPGIEKENMENIFLPAFSTKFDHHTGNIQRGLGLNLVKEYVEDIFNGTIQVTSEVGKFTQFDITIPENRTEVFQ